uniref:Condensin complex subunit 2 n=1 Tax=Culicoides sonorensis TaxID=179676 RepID=A0A336LLN1_CULSO
MTSIAQNTPVRRSVMMPPVDTPNRTPSRRRDPNVTDTSFVQTNDDEEERMIRRSTMSTTQSEDASMNEENKGLNICLQMYQDNKLNKENAWQVQMINNFSKLIARHHKSMDNFQVAGSALEASAKVYVLRVDSLHQDTLRMVSNLSRQSAKQLGAARNDDDDDDDDDMDRSNPNNAENDPNMANHDGAKKKQKRKRRAAAVVTKNPDSLNGKLDTNPFTDPFFAKLNSIVGDINSSSRLMQNMVGTKNGALELRMDLPFWDSSPAQPVINDENENYENQEIVRIKVNDANESHAIHHRLKGYSLSDKPAEDDPDEEMPATMNDSFNNSLHQLSTHSRSFNNNSGAAVAFDPNAEVEPITEDINFVMDFGAADDDCNDFDQLETDDREAIMRCKGLRREVQVIEDMRPVDATSSHLEYSYRPLDVIAQYWAGPSYWKFRKTRSMVKRSFSSVISGQDNEVSTEHLVANKRKAAKKKKTDLTPLDEFFNSESNAFITRDPANPVKGITYSRAYISKKWNAKKLRLPSIVQMDSDEFDKFNSGPQFHVFKEDPEVEPDIHVENYDYDNEADKDYCREVNVETDVDTETDFGGTDADHINTSDERLMSPGPEMLQGPLNQTVDFIGTEFAGAPEKVEKIFISYAKRAKPVDMKQLKAQCWNLISEVAKIRPKTPMELMNGVSEDAIEVDFNEVYEKLPRVLTKNMAENISTGLVFYSVLHLANERGVRLKQHEDLEGCTILKVDE